MQKTIFSPVFPKKAGEQQHWCNLAGSSSALAIANCATESQKRVVVVTSDTPGALKLEREIRHFLKHTSINISVFPDWETLAYDTFSPHQDIISQRLETLYDLTQKGRDIYIFPVTTMLQKVAPVEYLGKYVLFLKQGQTLDIEAFRSRLNRAGYNAVNQVMEHGEYSVRGSIVDLFPMGTQRPLRLDLFDDEIESIREFDPDSQRSGEKRESIRLLPAHEFPINKQGIEQFKENYKQAFDGHYGKGSIFHDVSSGVMPAGIEYYLPLFFQQTASIFDYISDDTLFVTQGNITQAIDFFLADVNERYEQHRWDPLKPLLPPQSLFFRVEELNSYLKQWPRINVRSEQSEQKSGSTEYAIAKLPDIAINAQSKSPYTKLQAQLKVWRDSGTKVLFCAETAGRKEALLELLLEASVKPKPFEHTEAFLTGHAQLGICVGYVDHSFVIHGADGALAFITETELLGHKVSQRRLRKKQQPTDESAVIRNLAELQPGQPVVHIEHGVGRYLGLQTLDAGGVTTEYLTIEYAKQSKLYVPVASLHLISRYSGGDDQAPLHNLGTDTWSKARQKAAEKVRDVAAQLLEVYAQREAKPGQACKIDWQDYRQFADSFPFEETDDQQQAINAVINDMGSPRAMDRLVCGDVGFGKTEVAMRAAFIAASQGKQVAVLVPTTLLAQQHFENFRDRMSQWPFQIEVMSRFNSSKEQKQVLAGLAGGKVDIVIGTHKLIQKDIKFADLGLLIIDEEHRFGVQQKERIKSLRAEVDILTLTATPIPRTLNMALNGMRDLSIIATPPAKRLAIKTFVKQRDKALIREAVMREILRGGQVYFLHNEVETIEKTASEISEIVPEAKVSVAHGQMREKELERVMSDFYHQRFNVLVCTTIIETGIDIPSANTIIMDRADHLGLAQLHQLRGRVGRSHHQAYAYMLTPHPKRMTKDATKRLEAIAQSDNLGAGFELATHDLEIRGAGELLGEEQSGQITTVGFSLYMDMLEEAVEALKAGKEPSLDNLMAQHTEVELRIPTLLPDDYIADVNVRLSMYKKIASCKKRADLKEIQIELIDRFGMLPEATKNLFKVHELKLSAKQIGITKIDANAQGGFVEFSESTKVDPGYIIQLIQTRPNVFRFDGPQKLKFTSEKREATRRLAFIENLLTDFNKQQKVA